MKEHFLEHDIDHKDLSKNKTTPTGMTLFPRDTNAFSWGKKPQMLVS